MLLLICRQYVVDVVQSNVLNFHIANKTSHVDIKPIALMRRCAMRSVCGVFIALVSNLQVGQYAHNLSSPLVPTGQGKHQNSCRKTSWLNLLFDNPEVRLG